MRKIKYRDDKDIDASIVCDFFNHFATWKVNLLPDKWKRILSNSCSVISAWADEDLIGMARGINDEVRYAQVLDVLFHPDYRRRGIGKKLISKLLSSPSMKVRGVILGTPTMLEFYESVGFECVNEKPT